MTDEKEYKPKHAYNPNVCPKGGRPGDGWHEWEKTGAFGWDSNERIKCKHCGLLGWD